MSIDTTKTIGIMRWSRITAGHLPCASCGIGVPTPVDDFVGEDVELLQVFGDSRHPERSAPQRDFAVTRCATCSMIRASARDLIVGNHDIRSRIGTLSIGVYRLECALGALDALGTNDAATIDKLTATGADIMRLLDLLTVPGGEARWTSHVQAAEFSRAGSTPASHARWSHVTEEQRQTLRNAAADLLAVRREHPVRALATADDGSLTGCLLCGVGAVETHRAQVDNVWTLMSADAQTIGGRPMPDTLDGVVCPTCDRAIDSAHGVGQAAMMLSVRAHLGVPEHIRSFELISGLVGWAALPAGTPPNTEPWGHMNLDEAREEVNAFLAGMTPRTRARTQPRGIDVRPLSTSSQMADLL